MKSSKNIVKTGVTISLKEMRYCRDLYCNQIGINQSPLKFLLQCIFNLKYKNSSTSKLMAFFLLGLLSFMVNTPPSLVTSNVVYLPAGVGELSAGAKDLSAPANSSTSAIYFCFASSWKRRFSLQNNSKFELYVTGSINKEKKFVHQRERERENHHTCEISPKPFQASHFAFPTKSIIPGFFVLHFPTVA